MTRSVLFVVVLLLVGGSLILGFAGNPSTQYVPPQKVGEGDAAPDFTLQDTAGNQVTLSDLRGKVVLVNFWATWCPPCRAEMPSMDRLSELMANDDFVMLAINIEENARAVVPEFLAKNQHSFPVLYDDQGVVQKVYGVYKFPESFVIRKDGVIDDKVIGAIDWAHPETVAYFKTLAKD